MTLMIGSSKITPSIFPKNNIKNQDKTITENGVYTADEGYTGLGEVTVDVEGGSVEVEAKNYTGANISEGDKVWINPYYYEGGSISNITGTSYVYTMRLLPDGLHYFTNNGDYYETGTNTKLGTITYFNSNFGNYNLFINTDGVCYVWTEYGTQRVDSGLGWSKANYVPVLGRSDLLVSSNNELCKIDTSTGDIIKTYSGVVVQYAWNYLKICARNNVILCRGANSGSSGFSYGYTTIDDTNDTVTFTSSNNANSVISINDPYSTKYAITPDYKYLFGGNDTIYDLSTWQTKSIANVYTSINFPATFAQGYYQFNPITNIFTTPGRTSSGGLAHISDGLSKTLWYNQNNQTFEEISLDYEALIGNASPSSSYFWQVFGNKDSLNSFVYGDGQGKIRYLTSIQGNMLVSYKNGNITINTQTGSAAENISAGSTGLVNVGAVIEPTGSITITTNGTHDVADYAEAIVNVPVPVVDKYKIGDRVTDDSNNDIGMVSGFFTDANDQKYAVVCLNAVDRLASGQYLSSEEVISDIPRYQNPTVLSATETATTNTDAILTTATSIGYTSSACSHCRSKSYMIDGVSYAGQLPNIAELIDIFKVRVKINTDDPTATQYSSLIIPYDKDTWSSSQGFMDWAQHVCVGWVIYAKEGISFAGLNNDYFVIPVLEIPLD